LTVRLDLDEIYNGKSITLTIERNIIIIGETDTKPKTEIENDNVTFYVEPGVNNGEIIILHSLGNKLIKNGHIQKVGNIKVVIEEISNKIFKRSPYQKSHIYMNQKISVFQALIGEFDFVVPGLNKQKINLNISKVVIKPGIVLCVPNKGMKCVVNGNVEYGNLYIIFDIEFPNELSKEQRTLMKNVSNYVETNSKKSFSEYSFTTTDELNTILTSEDSQNRQNNMNSNNEFGGIECNQQ
jgi:DnaJ family protein B protein 13